MFYSLNRSFTTKYYKRAALVIHLCSYERFVQLIYYVDIYQQNFVSYFSEKISSFNSIQFIFDPKCMYNNNLSIYVIQL